MVSFERSTRRSSSPSRTSYWQLKWFGLVWTSTVALSRRNNNIPAGVALAFSPYHAAGYISRTTSRYISSRPINPALSRFAVDKLAIFPNAPHLNPSSAATRPLSSRLHLLKGDNNGNEDNNRPTSYTSPGSFAPLDMSANNEMSLTRDTVPQVYPQRWIQLGYLSVLALLSDWICFSVAACPQTYETAFAHSAASLIDVFLFTNVAASFLVTDVVDKIGLQKAIQGAAILMTLGCWFRSGLSFLPIVPENPHLVPYTSMVIGTVMVGMAQPFFQCTPPLLSATWFASHERATSTAVALNFNQIGIATAFIVGGAMATTVPGLEQYFGLIAVLSTLTAVGTLLQFQNEPAIPPSQSELDKKLKGEQEPPFLESVQKFFQTRGFTRALTAFICSISITNIVGAFIDDILHRGGIEQQLTIDLAGAGFELAILLGGIFIGGYVDKTKEYKNITLACLAVTAFMCLPLGVLNSSIGVQPILLVAALLGLGFAAGPVQPINAELAVDVTYPGDETAVESVQQIGGNLISALLVPVAEFLSKQDYSLLPSTAAATNVRGDVILLTTLALGTLAYFSSFDAPLKRTMADEEVHDDEIVVDTDATILADTSDNDPEIVSSLESNSFEGKTNGEAAVLASNDEQMPVASAAAASGDQDEQAGQAATSPPTVVTK